MKAIQVQNKYYIIHMNGSLSVNHNICEYAIQVQTINYLLQRMNKTCMYM